MIYVWSNRIARYTLLFFIAGSLALAPFSPTFTYQKAEAGGGLANISTFAQQLVDQGIQLGQTAIMSVTSAAASFLSLKESALDGFAWYAINLVLEEMIRSVTAWVNAGFPDGGPAFIRDFRGFMLNLADGVAGDFILENTNLGFICSPFQLDIQFALTGQYLFGRDVSTGNYQPQCRISGILENIENFAVNVNGQLDLEAAYDSRSFAAGGWAWWMGAVQDQENNVFGAYAKAQAALNATLRNAKGEEIELLNWGRGFMCFPDQSDPNGPCNTPGVVIETQLNKALFGGQERLTVADEINELVGALFGQLVTFVLGETGLYGASFQPFADSNTGTNYDSLLTAWADTTGFDSAGSGGYAYNGGASGVGDAAIADAQAYIALQDNIINQVDNEEAYIEDANEEYPGQISITSLPQELVDVRAAAETERARVLATVTEIEQLQLDFSATTDPEIQTEILNQIIALQEEIPSAADTAQLSSQFNNDIVPTIETVREQVDEDIIDAGGTPGGSFANVTITTGSTVTGNGVGLPFSVSGAANTTCGQAFSCDNNGYSEFTQSADTRVVYVSASQGNDANSGLTADAPKRTIAAGKSLLRFGQPDWLLLRKGDTWTNEPIGSLSSNSQNSAISGRSASEPVLISSYGAGARPVLRLDQNPFTSFSATYGGNHVAIVGLDFYGYRRDPGNAAFKGASAARNNNLEMLVQKGYDSFRFEDNRVRFIQLSLTTLSGSGENAVVRNNVFDGNYGDPATRKHAHCVLSTSQRNMVVENNIFDTCGWNPNVAGADSNIWNRALYDAKSRGGTVFRNNVIANDASGVQLRQGGDADNNLFLRNPYALIIGSGQNNPVTVTGSFTNNVVLDSRNISVSHNGAQQPQGTGVVISSNQTVQGSSGSSLINGVDISGNIFAHKELGTARFGGIQTGWNPQTGRYTDLRIEDNIMYDWAVNGNGPGAVLNIPGGSGNTFARNIIQQPRGGSFVTGGDDFSATGNVYWSSSAGGNALGGEVRRVSFSDPERDITSYMQSIGIGGGYDEFMRRATQQSKVGHDERFTAAAVNTYIRAGFQSTGQTYRSNQESFATDNQTTPNRKTPTMLLLAITTARTALPTHNEYKQYS